MEKGQIRTFIEAISPQVNEGVFSIQRVVGQEVMVEADVSADGHDHLRVFLESKHSREKLWRRVEMSPSWSPRYHGMFTVKKQGSYEYRVSAGIDYSYTWRHGLQRKVDDGQEVRVELLDGIPLIDRILKLAKADEVEYLKQVMKAFAGEDQKIAINYALSSRLQSLFSAHPNMPFSEESKSLTVRVDRKRALFSSWYEFFPRSASSVAGKHGTFQDCIKLLPRIADLGFDIIYLPPIHPIGEVNRKGKNNAVQAKDGDVGCPWAIGSRLGGHKSIHPELGTLEDFRSLVSEAEKKGMEIALDIAFQCAPDHPWVVEHPQWFRWRADGSVQYAENPPKKYQDILPLHFECDDWKKLWAELTSVVQYWVDQGIRVFRVDNPHTKPFRFWQYMIAEIRKKEPDVIFLSEAFTAPTVMHALTKAGFTQSYTYFAWRNSKQELADYMEELTHGPGAEYFRPNFWPNTPDINPWNLQTGNETMFLIKTFLAATLSSNYGMYGPPFHQMVHEAVPGSEEYLDSEKYEIRQWDWNRENKLSYLIRMLNKARKENPALQQTNAYMQCNIENDNLFAYYKWDSASENHLLCIVNLDPYHKQEGFVQTPLHKLGVKAGHPIRMYDLLSGNSYLWEQESNYVALEPAYPFHLFVMKI